jgi:hypothetical protein
MSLEIERQFEEYGRCCLELAYEAASEDGRQRLLKMGYEYLHAAELMCHQLHESSRYHGSGSVIRPR